MAYGLDPDQDRHSENVGPYLGQNCFQTVCDILLALNCLQMLQAEKVALANKE